MSHIDLGGISLDCDDPAPLARFWADLLGGEIVLNSEEVVMVKTKHVLVTAMRVESYVPPTWPVALVPKQAHIDVNVDDLPGAEVLALSLGGVRAPLQPDPERSDPLRSRRASLLSHDPNSERVVVVTGYRADAESSKCRRGTVPTSRHYEMAAGLGRCHDADLTRAAQGSGGLPASSA